MKSTLTRSSILGFFAVYLLINPLALVGESETGLADLNADALLKRHIEAAGGEAALQKVTSQRLVGSLERHGNKAPIVRTQKEPNLFLAETRFPRPGTLKQGFDGKTGWIQHPLQGGRRLEGTELAAFAQEAWLHPALHLREIYPVRRWLGYRTVEGKKLTALSLARKKGAATETWFFDDSTTLLVRVEQTIDGGLKGEIPVVIKFEDYRRVSNIMIPFTVTTKLPTLETVLHVESVEHNIKLNELIFQAPF